jgi:hypothetical protein
MISDVLSEAVSDIEEYLQDPRDYSKERDWIKNLVARMTALRVYLDCPPNTDPQFLEDLKRVESQYMLDQVLNQRIQR